MSLATNVTEQRRDPRIPCHFTGTLRAMDSAHASATLDDLRRRNATVTLCNVSLGGACLESGLPLQAGHIVRLEFALSPLEGLATFVEVCWTRGTRSGVRFLALPEKGLLHLRQLVLRETRGRLSAPSKPLPPKA